MSLQARFMNRRGAGCGRSITSIAELEKILKGGYAALEVTVTNENGEEVAWREQHDGRCDDRRVRWLWSYDVDAVREALGLPDNGNAHATMQSRKVQS